MTYHRETLARDVLLVLVAAKPDSLPAVLAERSFAIADAHLAAALTSVPQKSLAASPAPAKP